MDLQKEVAKIGLLKHHGIPLDGGMAGAVRKLMADAGAAEDVVVALDKLLQSERPQDAVRLAGVVLHGLEQGAADDTSIRQTRLVVDAAACSESEVVRSFLMAVAERAGGAGGADGAEGGRGGTAHEAEGCDARVKGTERVQGVVNDTRLAALGSTADDLVELVDDGVGAVEDADEVRRLVLGLAEACGMGRADGVVWADRLLR